MKRRRGSPFLLFDRRRCAAAAGGTRDGDYFHADGLSSDNFLIKSIVRRDASPRAFSAVRRKEERKDEAREVKRWRAFARVGVEARGQREREREVPVCKFAIIASRWEEGAESLLSLTKLL